jgi:Ca2+-binding RTX toxin-like protein
MKNFSRFQDWRAIRPVGLAALAVAVAAAALGIVAGQGNAAPPVTSRQASLPALKAGFPAPRLTHGVLAITGTRADDKIALRLDARQPGILQVDVGDDGSADFTFDRNDVARIAVFARSGDDLVRIDESNGVFTDNIATAIDGGAGSDTLVGGSGAVTLSGGPGNDKLIGGNGAEALLGGSGNDQIDGNRGNDVAFMGAGDDTFVWDPGDGNDTIEGQSGVDTMLFNGANLAEKIDLTANGNRLKFTRDIAGITMDTHGVERVDFNALGGADLVTVNDLSGTDVNSVNVDLAATGGGGDGAADRVVVKATNGNDAIDVSGDAAAVKVSGLAATVGILHPEVANDRLEINTLAGNDSVDPGGLAAGAIQLFVNGVLVP